MYDNKWTIYKMENKYNGMVYIGKTAMDVNDNIQREITKASLLGKHVHDFGLDCFTVDILEDGLDDITVLGRRMIYIKKYNSKKPRGYNDVATPKKCY